MKKKPQVNLVTKNYLDQKLGELEKRVDKRFGTMEEVVKELKEEFDKFRKEFGGFRNEVGKFKDRALTTLDWLVGAFKKFDEEHTVLTGKYSEVNETIGNHEERISLLEKKTVHL